MPHSREGLTRLAALTSHPIQYQAPLWRALAKRLDLTVFFCSDHGLEPSYDSGFGRTIAFDTSLLEGYRYEFLPNLWGGGPTGNLFSLSNPSALWRLWGFDALLIRGYNHLTSWLAIAAGRMSDTALCMHVETPGFARSSRSRRLLKDAVLGATLRSFSVCLAIGSQNRAFYEGYGVKPERITLAPYAVDNAFFAATGTQLEAQRATLRHQMGIADGEVVALFVGKLTRRKHPELLVRAIGELSRHAEPPVRALLVGTGEEEPALRALVTAAGLDGQVTFAGFANQSELPRFYTASDLFVLPAEREYWGLVVNEAMNFGLPLLLGSEVAAADDLLRDGVNGFRLHGLLADELASRIRTLASDPALRRRMGAASRTIIADWGIDQAADAVASSVRLATLGRS